MRNIVFSKETSWIISSNYKISLTEIKIINYLHFQIIGKVAPLNYATISFMRIQKNTLWFFFIVNIISLRNYFSTVTVSPVGSILSCVDCPCNSKLTVGKEVFLSTILHCNYCTWKFSYKLKYIHVNSCLQIVNNTVVAALTIWINNVPYNNCYNNNNCCCINYCCCALPYNY